MISTTVYLQSLVFSKPNSFVFVSYIAIDNSPIADFDIVHIHHLSRLSVLSLCNTDIGNEAFVLLLTSILLLKGSYKDIPYG